MNAVRKAKSIIDNLRLFRMRSKVAYGAMEGRYGYQREGSHATKGLSVGMLFGGAAMVGAMSYNDGQRFHQYMELEEINRRQFYGREDLGPVPDRNVLPQHNKDFGPAGLFYFDPKMGVGLDYDYKLVGPPSDVKRPQPPISDEMVRNMEGLKKRYL